MATLRNLFVCVLALTVTSVVATSTYQACQTGHNSYPFCDTRLSIAERVKDLLSRMNTTEKILQMGNQAAGVERLGIPKFNWWTEALHGLNSGCFTAAGSSHCPSSFPAGINMAAAFNMDNVKQVGTAISDEVRAAYNTAGSGVGTAIWTPDINIFRDPRWGRGQETPGEDPVLSSRYGAAMIQGLQSDDNNYWKVAATAKHFACYSLETYGGVERVQFDAKVTNQDLFQTFYPAFESAVKDGNVHGVMCSYNSINGVPSCANEPMLQELLRGEWKFDGYVTGDCWALAAEVDGHHYAKTVAEAAADSIHAGTDSDCVAGTGWYNLNSTLSSIYEFHLQDALDQKLITEEEMEVSLARLYTVQMHMGMFDPSDQQPFAKLDATVLDSQEHRVLARTVARESIILLKNEGNVLPITPDPRGVDAPITVALIGPMFAATGDLCSNYHGALPHVVSIQEAFQNTPGVTLTTAAGVPSIVSNSTSGIAAAATVAAAADYAIVVVGINGQIEGEELDRYSIALPGAQNQLVDAIVAAQPNTIVVLIHGGMVYMDSILKAPAVVDALYPGEEGGNAIVDVLVGRYNPSGRLPYTVYANGFTDAADFYNYDMRKAPGLTYRFYQSTPVIPFGTGLSYTTFGYSVASLATSIPADPTATLTYPVTVTNTGSLAGDVSVLAFMSLTTAYESGTIKPPYVHYACPLTQLFDFNKVSLVPGASTTVSFTLTPFSALCVDSNGNKLVVPGVYTLKFGDATATLQIGSPSAPAPVSITHRKPMFPITKKAAKTHKPKRRQH